MKQKQKLVKSERGAVAALCEAVIEKAVDDIVYGVGKNKDEAIAFLTSGADYEFYAQMASVECVERAEEVRSIILGSSPVLGENIRQAGKTAKDSERRPCDFLSDSGKDCELAGWTDSDPLRQQL